ncbi:cupin domain-containing protein [Streptomyces sp. NPDC006643]|uniref:cupin domain-containing protein n=1 Tax=Streptomyces sp. NPDC006643 TaxID=3364756 RepID=UPI003687AE44
MTTSRTGTTALDATGPATGFAGLPGAVAVSHLTVYDWEAADGLRGGTPHLHLTCAEGYVVTAGRGAVQTLTADGFASTALTPGALVWFTPGTIHRLVNEDGLRIVVLMQNNGLPEAGDAVLTLPPEHLTDPETYGRVVRVPEGTEAEQAAFARQRRDLAVEGFAALRAAWDAGDEKPLLDFHRAAGALVRPRLADWRARWEAGAARAARETGVQLDRLTEGDTTHLADPRVHARLPETHGKFGMCGRLDTYAV